MDDVTSECVQSILKRHINKQTTYRELQLFARCYKIPCNLKKETMRIVIHAILSGRSELAKAIVKQVKDERAIQRKKWKEQAALKRIQEAARFNELNSQTMRIIEIKDTQISTEYNDNNNTCQQDVVVERKVEETTCENLTIRKTKTKTQFRTFATSTNGTDIATRCDTPNITLKPLRGLLSAKTTKDDMISKSLWSSQPPIYSSPPMKSESTMVSNSATRQYGDVDLPHHTASDNMVPCLPSTSGQNPEERTYSDFSLETILRSQPQDLSNTTPIEFFTPLPRNCPLTASDFENKMNDISSIITQEEHDSTVHDNSCPLTPSDLNEMNNMSSITAQEEPDSTLRDNSISSLECLAEMASLMQEERSQDNIRTSVQDSPVVANTISTNANSGSEFSEGAFRSTFQEMPMWNNFFGRPMITKCKFGCPVLFQNAEDQTNHETICLRQPFHCPSVNCHWVNQLRFLSTHIFTCHNMEIILRSEASFTLNFGNDHMTWNYCTNGYYEDGPKRQTFFQLVNHRLFVTYVIGDFQRMLLYIYVKWVDDIIKMRSTGAIEVLRPDGLPHQWHGKLYPLSIMSPRFLSHRHCLILDMNTFYPVQRFVIHVKIRNHEL